MKKGFTLVELLAVIVILAVILVIAVPQISNVIKQTKKNSIASTAKIIAAKAEEATVENEILESNEALTCSNLVKLDDNYGSCTVTVTNGVGTVTITGANKFAGITCTGTKSNMHCSESSTPEYIYSFNSTPYYDYEYTVTDSEACVSYLVDNLKNEMVNNRGLTAEQAQNQIESVCSNIDSDGLNIGTSEWFVEEINYTDLTYNDISSFVSRSNEVVVYGTIYDYTELGKDVFIRWNGNETEFSNASERSVCTLYGGSIHCFEAKSSAYETNKTNLQTLFGSSNCEEREEGTGEEYIPAGIMCADGNWSCGVYADGEVGCTANNGQRCRMSNTFFTGLVPCTNGLT